MPRYAAETTVPVERSRAELEQLLIRYKATAFTSGWDERTAWVAFKLKDLFVRFTLPIPDRKDKRFWVKERRGTPCRLTEAQAERNWDQELKARWRALLLVVKAKLEAVECGISTLEHEFLAFIVLPGDVTLGDWIIAHAMPQIKAGRMPLAALGPKADDDAVEGEVVPDEPRPGH